MATLVQVILPPDVVANRPAASIPGRLYFSTDEPKIYRDNGTTWDDVTPGSGGSGAPLDATYITTSSNGTLTNEVLLSGVIGRGLASARPTAGTAGRLYYATDTSTLSRDNGSTWDDLTFPGTTDHATLSNLTTGDPHTQYQKESEKGVANGYASLDSGGTVPDAQLPSTIARDTEISTAVTAHAVAADPHTGYQKESEKGVANGYASLGSDGLVPTNQLPAGSNQPPTAPSQDTFLVSGGQVVWQTGYQYLITAGSGYINGTLITWVAQTITLDAAHATLDRIDVIGVDDTETVFKLAGTAATNPSEPVVSPDTQLKLAIVLVDASSSAPSTTTESVYAENAGSGSEWPGTTTGTGWDVNNTTNPRSGTKVLRGVNLTAGAAVTLQKGSGTIDPNTYTQLVLYMRFTSAWNASRYLLIWLANAGVKVSNALRIQGGYFGLDGSNITDYQAVVIPMLQLAVPAGTLVNQVVIQDVGGAINMSIDDVSFMTVAGSSQNTTGLTQDQADARYAQRGNNLSDLTNAATARSNLGAAPSTASYIVRDAEGSLSNESTLGDVIGRGVLASRPAAAVAGRLYYATDVTTLYRDNGTTWDDVEGVASGSGQIFTINFVISGGTSAITTGIKGDLVVDFGCTINSVTLLADQTGSIVVDIWKDTYGSYPPTAADSITASAKPTISSSNKSQDTTLTGWTTSISAGQILRFNVDSVATIQRCTVSLKVTRT